MTTVGEVIRATAAAFGLSPRALVAPDSRAEVVLARHVAF